MSKKTRFLAYIRARRLFLVNYFLSLILLYLLALSQDLDMDYFIYASLLISLLSLIIFVLDFLDKEKTYGELEKILRLEDYGKMEFEDPLYGLLMERIEKLDKRSREVLGQMRIYEKKTRDFYSLWAHQIKTPISALGLILADRELDRRLIKDQVQKIEDYVAMILAYERYNSSIQDFQFSLEDLDSIIEESLRRYGPSFIRKKLRLDYDGVQVRVLTDRKWLVFILGQVISNSLKYTDQGYLKIYYKDETLFLEDSGIGIAREDLARVFELGYTGYSGRIYEKSTGIGLYLVKNMADLLRIGISIESLPGKFTRLGLSFPKKEDFLD